MSSSSACPNRAGQTDAPGRTVRLYFSPRARPGLFRARPGAAHAAAPPPAPGLPRRRTPPPPPPQLAPRHWDLLHLIAAGHTNTQIARQLGLSEGAVRTHLENIYARLQVSSRTAAITRAFPDRAAM